VIMGGSTGRGNRTPAAEFNIFFDPHAFDEVLKLKKTVPLVMVPLDTTNDVLCKDDVFEYLQTRIQVPLANAIHSMLRSYQEMYKRAYIDIEYPIIHDPAVIYYILHPEKYIVRDVHFFVI
jgi:inosine-uridine nucleoside N-ribohydrolase